MAVDFNSETQYLTFKSQSLIDNQPIKIYANSRVPILTIPLNISQEEMITYFNMGYWFLFDINNKMV